MRNSVDELFVEGTCNVFGVDVCFVLEVHHVGHLCMSARVCVYITCSY